MARARWAVRAVLLDPSDRLLLLRSFDPDNVVRGHWWTTVGGGVEHGEEPETALRREIREEVGIHEVELGPMLWRRRSTFRFRGVTYEQDNDYYLARTRITDVDGSDNEAGERETTLGHHWWSLDELQRTGETIYPNGLGVLLAPVLVDGPPTAPLVLDSDREGGLA